MFALLGADSYSEAAAVQSRSAVVSASAEEIVHAVLGLVRARRRLLGIGIGTSSELASQGAITALREGVLHADASTLKVGAGIPSELVQAAEAILRLLARVVWERTEAEWRVVDLMAASKHGRQRDVSAELGISAQATSDAVRRSGWRDELAGRKAAAVMLRLAEQTIAQW